MSSGDFGREQRAGTAGTSEDEHEHTPVTVHAVWQRGGVPYEVHRTVCSRCMQVLAERPLRRTAA